jgi:hypothetical protein
MVWKDIVDYLQSAADSSMGRFTVENAYKFISEKDWVLWVSIRNKTIEAIAITEVLNYPNRKICAVRVLTGKDYANWIGLEDGIASWAKSVGCDGMEALARKGWAKIFTQYDCTHVFLERKF